MEMRAIKRAKIELALRPPYISTDEEDEGGFITHQPSWQSEKFKSFKNKLDLRYLTICSKASKRLLPKRTIGTESNKDVEEDVQWIIKDNFYFFNCILY